MMAVMRDELPSQVKLVPDTVREIDRVAVTVEVLLLDEDELEDDELDEEEEDDELVEELDEDESEEELEELELDDDEELDGTIPLGYRGSYGRQVRSAAGTTHGLNGRGPEHTVGRPLLSETVVKSMYRSI